MLKKLIGNKEANPSAEMSFIDHLEELRWHIIRALIAVGIASIFIFANIEYVVDRVLMGPVHPEFITYQWLCQLGNFLHLPELCLQHFSLKFLSNAMTEQFLMTFTLSFTGGFVLAFPYVFWEIWRFVRPALSHKEKSGTTGAIIWVSVLFFVGVMFGYLVLTPFMVNFYSNYSLSPLIEFKPTISDYFENLMYLTVGIGLLFQLPVVITPLSLKRIRKFAFVVILIAAAIITPSTDPFSLALVTLPLYLLYEFSIVLSMRIYRRQMKEEEQEWS
jgi:sec-independent protein translocase protein TatC